MTEIWFKYELNGIKYLDRKMFEFLPDAFWFVNELRKNANIKSIRINTHFLKSEEENEELDYGA